MTGFTIEGFARACKEAMATAEDRQRAASACLRRTLAESRTEDVLEALEAAIPAGADIGEMIVHLSPELTMLYGRIPPRFRSGIHNHTVFACIGQLVGREANVLYEPNPDGAGLRVVWEKTVQPGEVIDLPVDAIHHIENPTTGTSSALHVYGGDFSAVMDRRSIWTSGDHEQQPFSFELLLRESARAMKRDGNAVGLEALVKAVPASRYFVEGLTA